MDFGSYFSYREAEVRQRVYIGTCCIIGKTRIGNDARIGSGFYLLSGKGQQGFEIIDQPIQRQVGTFKQIEIGENAWIGNCEVIMAYVDRQNVIGAGSVVSKETGNY